MKISFFVYELFTFFAFIANSKLSETYNLIYEYFTHHSEIFIKDI